MASRPVAGKSAAESEAETGTIRNDGLGDASGDAI